MRQGNINPVCDIYYYITEPKHSDVTPFELRDSDGHLIINLPTVDNLVSPDDDSTESVRRIKREPATRRLSSAI